MTTSTPTLAARAMAMAKLDRRPLTDFPSNRKVAMAGVVAIVGSLVADAVLVAVARAAFSTPSTFGPFHFGSYAPLTILGVVGATVGWGILVRLSSQPLWVLLRAAVVVTVVLLIPDVMILPGNPKTAVLTLMVMHIAIAVATYSALRWISPATGQARHRTDPRQTVAA